MARRSGGAARVVDQPTEEGVGRGEEKEEVGGRCSGDALGHMLLLAATLTTC